MIWTPNPRRASSASPIESQLDEVCQRHFIYVYSLLSSDQYQCIEGFGGSLAWSPGEEGDVQSLMVTQIHLHLARAQQELPSCLN